ncbi:MAG TPA: UvrD-helicase domain-containing protein, partial [Acidimicrobiales bacterium]|nr:UvrD-helicase domain-containing protein [Acidimicrobiales bacterium]
MTVDGRTLADPAPAVGALHEAWAGRRPVVVALAVDVGPLRFPPSVAAEPWTLAADFEIWEDRLQFLLWANNYDARSGEPVWWWSRKAARLGAKPARGAGDVVVPGRGPAWIDGGPRQWFPAGALNGAAVVHRESVERGVLAAAPPPGPSPPDLAADQQAAVTHNGGAARVIAPAGSGKTRVLTSRLRHLICDLGWERSAVLAVAYNKRAQEELDARTAAFRPRTRTLNSLGYAIVSDSRGAAPPVLDERATRRLVDSLAPARRQRRSNTDPIAPYLEALSEVRMALVDPAAVEEGRGDVPGLAQMFPRYRAALAEAGAVDFDEQVYGAIEALLADGGLRARTQAGCRHVLVDEFQDLTPAHVLMLRLASSPVLDCFGVGDDDQVIYGHAGADPRFLLEFHRLFPGAGNHVLEVNYRCPPAVVTAAGHLLSRNRRRVPKRTRPGRTGDAGGLTVRLEAGKGKVEALVTLVQEWLAGGDEPSQLSVLTRVNSLLLAPQVGLATAGVPTAGGLDAEALGRTGLRAALAYLRLAVASEGAMASADIVDILRRPTRGLAQWFPDRLRRRRSWSPSQLEALAAAVPAAEAPKVEHLAADLAALRAVAAGGASTAALLRFVEHEVGLGRAMGQLDRSRGAEGSSHLDDLEALHQVAALQPDPVRFEPWLREVLGRRGAGGGVLLSSIHRVKGMEWDRVVVWGADGGIMPHRLAEDVEEERRVFHVAITRARRLVVVIADRQRPSPFLAELRGPAPPAPRRLPAGGGRPAAAGAGLGDDRARRPVAYPAAPHPAGGVEEALRAWRKERARLDQVPAYVVFSDRTLEVLVAS